MACKDPRYGVWGGPPAGQPRRGRPQAAQDLANAPRGKINLKAVVRSPLPTLGLPGKPRPLRPGEKR